MRGLKLLVRHRLRPSSTPSRTSPWVARASLPARQVIFFHFFSLSGVARAPRFTPCRQVFFSKFFLCSIPQGLVVEEGAAISFSDMFLQKLWRKESIFIFIAFDLIWFLFFILFSLSSRSFFGVFVSTWPRSKVYMPECRKASPPANTCSPPA